MIAFGVLLRQLRLATTRPGRKVYVNGPVRWRLPVAISQSELGIRAAVDGAYINRCESGAAEHPRRSTVERLAVGLELDELGTARLLVAAGYWPFPELDDEATDLALAVVIAVGNGDWRPLEDAPARTVAGERRA